MLPKIELRNMPQVRLAPALEVKRDPDNAGKGIVQGLASAFGGPPDSYGDIIAPGAFRRTISEHKSEGSMPLMLWSHDPSAPIGRWTEMKETDQGLFVRGQINLETSRGQDANAHIKAGDINGLSIGFYVGPNGKKAGENGTTIIVDCDLVEVSVVAMPANRRARIQLDSKRALEDLLQKSGLPRAAAVKLAAGGWPALLGADPEEQTQIVKSAADRILRAAELMKG